MAIMSRIHNWYAVESGFSAGQMQKQLSLLCGSQNPALYHAEGQSQMYSLSCIKVIST